MILGFIPINTAYAIVVGAMVFAFALAAVAWGVHLLLRWSSNRKLLKAYMELHGSNNDSDKNKS